MERISFTGHFCWRDDAWAIRFGSLPHDFAHSAVNTIGADHDVASLASTIPHINSDSFVILVDGYNIAVGTHSFLAVG